MKAVIFPLCAVVVWAALAAKLVDLCRDRANPALVALCTALGSLAVAFTLAVPGTVRVVDRLTGVPNVGWLGLHVSVIVFSASAQVLLLFWAHPREAAWQRAKRRMAALSLVLGAMVALFVLAGIEQEAEHYVLDNAGSPVVTLFVTVYVTALGVGLLSVTRLCWQYAGVAGRTWLVRGLRVTAAGTAVAMGYCVARFADVVGSRFGADPHDWEALVPLCTGIGTLTMVGGLTMPAWGPQVSALARWAGRYRSHYRLYPLWAAVYRATPAIALDPPSSVFAARLAVRDLDFRLYRRLIEIRDGRRALRPYLDPGVWAAALEEGREAGLSGAALEAAAEARALATALRRKLAGTAIPAPGETAAAPLTESELHLDRGPDLGSEIAWLLRVAEAFSRTARSCPLASPPSARP